MTDLSELDARVLAFVREHPGVSTYGVGRELGRHALNPCHRQAGRALRRLHARGLVYPEDARSCTNRPSKQWRPVKGV